MEGVDEFPLPRTSSLEILTNKIVFTLVTPKIGLSTTQPNTRKPTFIHKRSLDVIIPPQPLLLLAKHKTRKATKRSLYRVKESKVFENFPSEIFIKYTLMITDSQKYYRSKISNYLCLIYYIQNVIL